jgi:hypothetical protein
MKSPNQSLEQTAGADFSLRMSAASACMILCSPSASVRPQRLAQLKRSPKV